MDYSRSPYELVFTEQPDYLRADVSGDHDSVAISTAYWSEIAQRCRETGVRKLLVVERLEEKATLGDTVEIVDALVALGFKDIVIAYVDLNEEAALLSHTDLLAKWAGLRGRTFSRVQPAIDWLLAAG